MLKIGDRTIVISESLVIRLFTIVDWARCHPRQYPCIDVFGVFGKPTIVHVENKIILICSGLDHRAGRNPSHNGYVCKL